MGVADLRCTIIDWESHADFSESAAAGVAWGRLQLISFLLVSWLASIGNADLILFETGFESPEYAQGPLMNQDGWFNSTVPVVQQATKFSGLQAVRFDATGLTGQNSARHLFSYSSVGNPELVVKFSMQAMISSSDTQSRWTIFSVFSPGVFQAQVNVHPNGTAELRTAGNPPTVALPIAYDVWNRFDLEVDMSSKLATAYVNGLSLGQKQIAAPSETSLFQMGFGVNSSPGTDAGYFDDLRIESVPEPSSLCFAIIGAAITCMRRRKHQSV